MGPTASGIVTHLEDRRKELRNDWRVAADCEMRMLIESRISELTGVITWIEGEIANDVLELERKEKESRNHV